MIKSRLAENLELQTGIHPLVAAHVVDILFQSMIDSLMEDGCVEIRGFGSFRVKTYGGYEGRNPQTGEVVKVEPKRLPSWKMGKELKERVRRGQRSFSKLRLR